MNIPKHIAYIMDGNGRWAKEQGHTRTYGHKKGVNNLMQIVRDSKDLGVQVMTVYAFSTENWNRPKFEINYLMSIPEELYKKHCSEFLDKDIKVIFIGRKDRVPTKTLEYMEKIENETKDCQSFQVVIGFDYGSYDELINMIKIIANQVKDGIIKSSDIDEDVVNNNLFTAGLPAIDLMIRTSGEQRLSNYLLWQLAYAELYFTSTYWPAFKKDDLIIAIKEFNNRNRRFGSIEEE